MGQPRTLLTVLASTMAASTFMLLVFGVFADEIIETFGVERWQVGLLVTAATGVSAVVSPAAGRLADRIGARRSTVLTLLFSAVSLSAVGLAPTYLLLVVAAVLTAWPQALANPATNKLIAQHVGPGVRGVVTGIKQSGVQVGVFVGGFTLPLVAQVAGWRVAVLVFAVAWLAFAMLGSVSLPADPTVADREGPGLVGVRVRAAPAGRAVASDATPLPPLVRRITVYGFLLGGGGSAFFTYLPLFAEEVLGTTDRVAGLAVSATGLVGIVARIAWARAAEHDLGAVRALRIIALLAVLAAVILLLAGPSRVGLLWPAAVVAGLSASAWNSVGMLAIIQGLPPRETGRASGLVMFGFLSGLAVGAPAFGWSVDTTGSYVLGWTAAAVAFAVAYVGLVGAREPVRHHVAVDDRRPTG